MKRIFLPGLGGLYASNFLLQFGFSLVGIFIPLYIFKITQGLGWVLAFYLVFNLTIVVFTLPIARLVAKFGSDWIAFSGTIPRALFIIFLILAERNPVFFLWAAIFWGLAVPLYWLPFHLSVVGSDHKMNFGQDAARISLVAKLAVIAGPIIGGLIIQTAGFTPLYLLGLFLIIISGFPLFFDKYEFKFPDISLKTLKENLPFKQMPRLFLGYFGAGITTQVYDIIWPLYVFLLIGSYQFLGAITSVSLLASFILLMAAGKLTDRFGNKVFRWSVPLNFINWLVRPFFGGPFFLFSVNLIYELVGIFIWIPLDRLSYYTAVQTKRLEFFLAREIALHSGSFLAALTLIPLMNLSRPDWILAFVWGALGLLLLGQLGFAKEEGLKSAGVILIREDGAVLMQHRDNKVNIVFPNCWCLPGGKVEVGEEPETAARRELKEETGYEADSLSLLAEEVYSLPGGQKITRHIFWTVYDGQQKTECFEGQKMEFLKLDEMKTRNVYPGHEEFCRQALEKFKS
ncbi:MAG: MFS transporter [bacterium]|nr:MFS transporter [bacterium]